MLKTLTFCRLDGTPLEEWAFLSRGWVFCCCGHRQMVPLAQESIIQDRHKSYCVACGHRITKIDDCLLLGPLELSLDEVISQELYRLDSQEEKVFAVNRFTLTLDLRRPEQTLIGYTVPTLYITERAPLGQLLNQQEIPLSNELLRRDIAQHWHDRPCHTDHTIPCDIRTVSHLPGFVVRWLTARLYDKKDRLQCAPQQVHAERLISHLFVPSLRDEPIPIVGLNREQFERGMVCHSFEEFCASVVLSHHNSKSVRRSFFKALSLADDTDFFDIRPLALIESVFRDPNLLSALLLESGTLLPSIDFLKDRDFRLLAQLLKEATRRHSERTIARSIQRNGFDYWEIDELEATLALWSLLKEKSPISYKGTLRDIHSRLTKVMSQEKWVLSITDEPFAHSLQWRKLEGKIGDIEFRLPRSPRELALWGLQQKNCLASYVQLILAQEVIVLAVIRNGVHVATCQITEHGELADVAGPKNEPTEDDIPGKLLQRLKQVFGEPTWRRI